MDNRGNLNRIRALDSINDPPTENRHLPQVRSLYSGTIRPFLVQARGREWVVQPESEPDLLILRPLGGTDDEGTGVYLPLISSCRC